MLLAEGCVVGRLLLNIFVQSSLFRLSRATLCQFLLAAMLCSAIVAPAQQRDLELAHLSSLNLFTSGGLDSASAQSLTQTVQQLNELQRGTPGPEMVVVTGSVGINQALDDKLSKVAKDDLPAIPATVQSSLDQSAR
jgi:hypothetical protein